jgi:stalled ribosome rescue protein Dom34
MNHFHALVWLDHREAKVFHLNEIEAECERVHSSHPNQHLHHKANAGDSGHAPLDKEFLHRVSQALAHSGAILIAGPGSAKTELTSYIESNAPEIASRVCGVKTVDHPSDGELIALARSFFKANDRMHFQSAAHHEE